MSSKKKRLDFSSTPLRIAFPILSSFPGCPNVKIGGSGDSLMGYVSSLCLRFLHSTSLSIPAYKLSMGPRPWVLVHRGHYIMDSYGTITIVSRSVASTDAIQPCQDTTERKLLAKIDLRLIPVLTILYILAFLDRVNISNAAIFGLREDLNLGGVEYNTALTIFFIPYILFEIPSNILMKKFRPHLWLSLCMFMFGLVTCLQGFVQSYGGLLATRFFLGIFEAGIFPGCFYLIAMWYKREEAQKRCTFFFSSTTLAGAFGGLLASAIGKMDGMQGFKGWRWIFILEGVLTCTLSFFFYFHITDFPEEASFLTEDEVEFVKARLLADVGHSGREKDLEIKDILDVFKDYKIFMGGLMYIGLVMPGYGYAYFSPAILKDLGYSAIQTQLHSVPPWVCAFAFAMAIATISDHLKHRFAFAMFPLFLAFSGFSILLAVHDNTKVQYAALFLAAMGCYSAMPVIACWFNLNLGGHRRRAVGTAWQIGFGNIGGIIATYSFISKDAPRYSKGHAISLGFICLSALSCVAYYIAITTENRKRDNGQSKYSSATEEERKMLGDLHPEYRYLR
ncbi:major facilitator superfamily domain-containing protein [Tuber borchii]|uniref:Major facilitator superfamily domain-containing protein n=1 Tax=Tuber borchii TaxID=42251 RepID=A0A2T6ZJZ9_TUBBO|nr:major facilitator superfamily domain-containing protein [Tuber borchii]